PPYKAIHPPKGIRMRMLEVVKPATKRRIQIGDDFRQTVPTRALSPHSNAILHGLVALFAYPAPPQLEVIAQKVKALPRLPTISHLGLVGTKTQAMGDSTQALTCASAASASSRLRQSTTKSSA